MKDQAGLRIDRYAVVICAVRISPTFFCSPGHWTLRRRANLCSNEPQIPQLTRIKPSRLEPQTGP